MAKLYRKTPLSLFRMVGSRWIRNRPVRHKCSLSTRARDLSFKHAEYSASIFRMLAVPDNEKLEYVHIENHSWLQFVSDNSRYRALSGPTDQQSSEIVSQGAPLHFTSRNEFGRGN